MGVCIAITLCRNKYVGGELKAFSIDILQICLGGDM